jgi:dTDP-4-dehydrorhamnose reductase
VEIRVNTQKMIPQILGIYTLTIRTSIIGHELKTRNGLVEWFLSQNKWVDGYSNAIFSGLTTLELARVIGKYIIPSISKLSGLYNVSTAPINKYTLLTLIAKRYGKNIIIREKQLPKIDRSLDSSKFRFLTGYKPPDWKKMIENMYNHYLESKWYKR